MALRIRRFFESTEKLLQGPECGGRMGFPNYRVRMGAGVVDRARLESVCAFTGTVGSNPTPSARNGWSWERGSFELEEGAVDCIPDAAAPEVGSRDRRRMSGHEGEAAPWEHR